jgi:hypothetical protein
MFPHGAQTPENMKLEPGNPNDGKKVEWHMPVRGQTPSKNARGQRLCGRT